MQQLEFFEIANPCKGICTTDSRGYCLGCFRSRDERFHWNQLNIAQKKHVIKLCLQRQARRAKGNLPPIVEEQNSQGELFL